MIASELKFHSIENIESNEENIKKSRITKITKTDYENKQNLKKASTVNLKMKVIDPFEKRSKQNIQNEFQNESVIRKN